MIPDHPERGNWPRVEITSEGYDEGLGIGDINGDGLLDISGRYGKDGKSLAWWQNPGNGSGNWTKHPVGTTRVEMDRNVMADLNGDGRPDIVVTEESDWNGDSVYWFENPSGPVSSNWVRHKLTTQFSTNSPDVRDMNNSQPSTASQSGWRSGRMWATGLPGLSTSFLLVVRITLALLLRIWTAMEISISWKLRGTVTSSSTCGSFTSQRKHREQRFAIPWMEANPQHLRPSTPSLSWWRGVRQSKPAHSRMG